MFICIVLSLNKKYHPSNLSLKKHDPSDIYQEWKLKVEQSQEQMCADNFPWRWRPAYMLCDKTLLPKTRTVSFSWDKTIYWDKSREDIDWKGPIFAKEDPPERYGSDYRVGCDGDSGAAEMALTYSEDDDVDELKIKEKF